MIRKLFIAAAASVVNATDPCAELCDAIPAACGADGSRCVDQVCTDLFWKEYFSTLCNASMEGCPDTSPVDCVLAGTIAGLESHLGVKAYVQGPDPCPVVCDEIPGACGPDGSRCVGEFCSDLFWMEGTTLCHSSIMGCPDTSPLLCATAEVVGQAPDHLGVTAALAEGGVDPCSAICEEIPDACGPDGSRCVGQVCTDLFWSADMTSLCNPSIAGCPDTYSLQCGEAAAIVQSDYHLGVGALATRVVEALDFVPGTGIVGRRGFANIDSTTSHLASVLQVVLHSRAVRRAVGEEVQFGAASGAMQNPIFSALVTLLKQMYEAGDATEALDLTEFRFAVMEIVGYDQTIDHPIHILGITMDQITRGSIAVEAALGMETHMEVREMPLKRAAFLVPFPKSQSTRTRWSIKEMMQEHFLYNAVGGRITEIAELVSIAIDRNPGESTERVNSYVETPLEIDFAGIMEGGEEHRFRLVGIVRDINGKYVADYFDSDSGEWIHANDSHLHVITGQPRNGGTDAVIVMYERI